MPASPEPGLTSYFTIGLGEYSSQRTTGSGLPLRFEFTMVAREEVSVALTGLGNSALTVATGDYSARPGAVYPDIFGSRADSPATPHGLLWFTSSWERGFEGHEIEGVHAEWLQVIPVTASERQWVAAHGPGLEGGGPTALLEAFEAQSIDVYDFDRASAVLPA